MGGPGLVDRDDLLVWAKTFSAPRVLPELIERLIRETAPGLTSILMPSGSGVATHGYDGIVRSTTASDLVPAGLVLWELSTREDCNTKADKDYKDALETPDGSPTTDAVYIEVILRPWEKAETWAATKQAEGRWREVRAYNVDQVMSWLRDAPVTHAWLTAVLGRRPHGYESAERWWLRWSEDTDPALPAELLTAGRDESCNRLREILAGAPKVTTVSGASSEEVTAFIVATLQATAAAGDATPLRRTAVVHDLESWRVLNDHRHPLILIPASAELFGHVVHNTHHHVLVPTAGPSAVDLELERIDIHQAAHALEAAGLPTIDAPDRARLARRSLTALRRRLAKSPALHTPPWAKEPTRINRGLLLTAAWDGDRAADQEVVTQLTGSAYDELEDPIDALARAEDPLITGVGALWQLVSPQDAWLLLASAVKASDLDRLGPLIEAVLLEPDPALADENASAVFPPRRKHSARLRRGLADTLAQLGVHGSAVKYKGGVDAAQWVQSIVARVLAAANADPTGRSWNSLYDVLQQLAEAAPDAFLAAVTKGSSGPDPVVRAMFTQPAGPRLLAGQPRLSYLLFALETLAWSSDHFGAAVEALARLAEIEPHAEGDRTDGNHPLNSLAQILGPVRPQTTADAPRRLAAIDTVLANHPETGWRLLLKLAGTRRGLLPTTAEPHFRQWKQTDSFTGTPAELAAFAVQAGERLITAGGSDAVRWERIVGRVAWLPPQIRTLARERLQSLVSEGEVAAGSSGALWHKVRGLVADHREHPNAAWAMPADEVAGWEGIEQGLRQTVDVVDRHSQLFDTIYPRTAKYPPFDPDSLVDPATDADYVADLENQRLGAIKEIEQAGLERVQALAAAAPFNAHLIGKTLADTTTDKYRPQVLELLISTEVADQGLAWGWLVRRLEVGGWDLAEKMLAETSDPRLSARILRATSDWPKAWERADELGADVAKELWSTVNTAGMPTAGEVADLVADRLIEVGRVAAVAAYVLFASRAIPEDRTTLLRRTLQAFQAGHQDDPEAKHLTQHDFVSLLAALRKDAGEDDHTAIAALEWAFLAVLGPEPYVPVLSAELTRKPDLFVDVVSAMYPPEQITDPDPLTPEQAARSANAMALLGSMTHLPGLGEDGTVDPAALNAWVKAVLDLGAAAGRRDPVAFHVGHVLGNAPTGSDGVWPCDEVRQVLQDLSDDNVEDGLLRELMSRRGVVGRGWDEDGHKERDLAAKYAQQAAVVADRWPRLAGLLRRIAENYTIDAAERDETVELRRSTSI